MSDPEAIRDGLAGRDAGVSRDGAHVCLPATIPLAAGLVVLARPHPQAGHGWDGEGGTAWVVGWRLDALPPATERRQLVCHARRVLATRSPARWAEWERRSPPGRPAVPPTMPGLNRPRTGLRGDTYPPIR
jgi:hypothetical protein